MKFKNIHTETGKLRFKELTILFSGVLETEDKDLINFLKSSSNWELISTSKAVEPIKADKGNV